MRRPRRSPVPVPLLAFALLLLVTLAGGASRASGLEPQRAAVASFANAEAAALSYLEDNRDRWQLTRADLDGLELVDGYTSQHNGVSHLYFWQKYAGIEVAGAMLNVSVAADGAVLHAGNRLIPDLEAKVNTDTPALAAGSAVRAAASALQLSPTGPLRTIESFGGPAGEMRFDGAGISREPIPARLIFQPTDAGEVRLAWEIEIYEQDGQHYWRTRVDAADGSLLEQVDHILHDHWGPAWEGQRAVAPADARRITPRARAPLSAPGASLTEATGSYRVFAVPTEHPEDGPRSLVTDPAHPIASPYGWHDTDGEAGAEYTITRGNNAFAYLDYDMNDQPDLDSAPDGGPTLTFDFALDLTTMPALNTDASVTNLFYWVNLNHDLFYLYGFDEPAGNFQHNNYGNAGIGGDFVVAETLDSKTTNRSSFLVLPDGRRPRMELFLWDAEPHDRDAAFSSMIITHEYGHGISGRLTGGPSTTSCLNNDEQMGEGWSDFFGLALTAEASDTGSTPRGVGVYVTGSAPAGLRPSPYSTNMGTNGVTYGDLSSLSPPYDSGYAWASMLWDVYWMLVDKHGFNSDLYGDWTTGGNNLALQLVVDGLKLQPCEPGFVDGRDAILAADAALTNGDNQCLLWEAFARRGLGYSADQGDPDDTTDGVEAFDMPPTCNYLLAQPQTQTICSGQPAVYTVRAGDAFSPPVTLSRSNVPGEAVATFGTNPLQGAPATTSLTIEATEAVEAGAYDITITGNDGQSNHDATVALAVVEEVPGAITLTSPADGAVELDPHVSFQWASAAGAESYFLEVDDDPTFDSIDYSATVAGTSHVAGIALSPSTTYYWRVSATNACGSTMSSAAYSFTVMSDAFVCNGIAAGFDNGIPDGWTVVDNSASGEGIVWATTADSACEKMNETNGQVDAACADSEAAGPRAPAFDTWLVSPPFDLPANASVTLDLEATYRDHTSGNDTFDIDIWSGESWSNRFRWDSTQLRKSVSLNLDDYVGQDELKVRFRYLGNHSVYFAQVDDVTLNCTVGGVTLSPETQRAGAPGADVTHTIEITNTGDAQDSFDLALSGDSWPSALSHDTVMLAAGASTTVDVTVSIPAGASGGASDTATLTAQSQTFASLAASTELQTTAVTYGVTLSPDAQASAAAGSELVYSVDITNAGSAVDSFDLALSSHTWSTELSDTRVTLAAGESASVDVTVKIPGGAATGATDTATVTATSQADTDATASTELQTTVVSYDVALSPDSQAKDIPGADVNYTVYITNTGSTADTYELVVTGHSWSTSLSQATVTLASGASTTVDVTVSIPAGAAGGDSDTATVTATSQTHAAASASSELETTAVTYGVGLSPDAQDGDLPGMDVTYVVQVTNTGSAADSFKLTVGGNLWPASLSQDTVALPAGDSTSIEVTVSIPAGATGGESDTATVTATSQTHTPASASIELQTTAVTYGVVLSPNAQASATLGTNITYPVHITNTGSTADTFDMMLTGNSWAADLSAATVALAAGASTSIEVTVSVPAGASGGDSDTAMVTATSQTHAAASASTELETTAITYGVALSPGAQAGATPGDNVIYTVQITNTGAAIDSYDLALSGNAWDAELANTAVTLAAGASASVEVTVRIPAGAAGGDTDTATVTATSHSHAAAWAATELRTTAITYGVALSPEGQATAMPGTDVTHTVHITNTGSTVDTFALALSRHSWATTLSHSAVTLDAAEWATFDVTVTVPAGAAPGEGDGAVVTATSQHDPTASAAAALTTTAADPRPYRVYLPGIISP